MARVDQLPSRRLAIDEGHCRIEHPHVASSECIAYRAFALRAELGECPLWSPRERSLWSLDIALQRLHRFDPATGDCDGWQLPARATAIVATSRHTLIAAMADELAEFDAATGALETIARLDSEDASTSVFNDARCDRSGRLWIGTRHRDRLPGEGALWRLDADCTLRRIDPGYTMPNGIACSPVGDALYVADSRAGVIHRYGIHAASGEVGERSEFARFAADEGTPDGLTADAEGGVWAAIWGGSALRRYAPDGSLERTVALPVQYPTSCVFGGAQMNELYVTSASAPIGERAPALPARHEGAVLMLAIGFRGIEETPLASSGFGAQR